MMALFNPHQWLRCVALITCITPLTAQAVVLSDWQGSADEVVVASVMDQSITWVELQLAVAKVSDAEREVLTNDAEAFATYVKRAAVRKYIMQQALNINLDDSKDVEMAQDQQAYNTAMIEGWLNLTAQPEADFPSQEAINETYQSNQQQFVIPGKVNLSQLFLQSTDNEEADTERVAQVLAEIQANPNTFPSLAKAYSDDATSAVNFGNLGWLQIDQLQPIILKAISEMKMGDISLPIATSAGKHFILVNDLAPSSIKPLEDVQNMIVVAIRKQSIEAEKQTLLTQLFTVVNVKSVE
jgi:parvulin-like peptidyl-prolyl isomerase